MIRMALTFLVVFAGFFGLIWLAFIGKFFTIKRISGIARVMIIAIAAFVLTVAFVVFINTVLNQ